MAKSLTKEEKLNHLVNISKSLIEVREKVKEEMEKLPPQFNVFNSINLLNHENYNSNLFANFLDIKFKHNGNEIGFAKLFLKYLNEEFGWEFDLENIKIEDIKIKMELPTEERKRIDIFIGYKEKFAVIIENKIWADDGYKQLENYYNHVKKNYIKKENYDKIYIIYLTPYEREPSEESLSKELYKKEGSELYEKFKNIKHEEIGKWINDSILENEEFSFLHKEDKENNKNDYKLLKSALIQIIDNEKSISGENEEGDMTEAEIKKVLKENLFKDIKTIEKADEYIEMFDKVKNLLVKQKIQILIEFTKKIDNYLKSKNYKEGEHYTLLKDKYIIKEMLNSNYPHPIEFNINNIKVSLEYERGDMSCYFGIYTEDENMPIKIRKKLKTSIENIFNDFDEYREEGVWLFLYYIDIEKDKPQEIAEVMIKLYELLKKEIK